MIHANAYIFGHGVHGLRTNTLDKSLSLPCLLNFLLRHGEQVYERNSMVLTRQVAHFRRTLARVNYKKVCLKLIVPQRLDNLKPRN